MNPTTKDKNGFIPWKPNTRVIRYQHERRRGMQFLATELSLDLAAGLANQAISNMLSSVKNEDTTQ
ncbi:hypothetical protein KCM76_23380 [Zooshikella marina]|uniref:hypothetical protein n=1 Tax=Zooshikella ganghwensis TaxID=202772 RepID=UPI001BAEAB63|nr:hypothetical protein [Zooshikella ganghwensis]MBU2708957.1 hypothetical protein [Zooshikella ganghwensis]